MTYNSFMKCGALCLAALLGEALLRGSGCLHAQSSVPGRGLASWYGETHRGRVMANGKKFDPDRCTAASWFYPLGTRVTVSVDTPDLPPRSLVVTVTDRGPAPKWVDRGRIIDLSRAAFEKLAPTNVGLIPVTIKELPAAR